MKNIVIGLFDNKSQAQTVEHELVKEGYSRGDIYLATNEAEFRHATRAVNLSEEELREYANSVKRGGVMVAAETNPSRAERALQIMNAHETKTAGRSQPGRGQEIALPVIEEELQIGKRVIERGGVRIYSHVTERPVEQQVQLREEHVNVERRPADRPASEQDLGVFAEGQLELTETVEQPVVAKQPHVVEEVIIGKQVQEHTETIRDTVQRADIEVERMSGAKGKQAPATPRNEAAPAFSQPARSQPARSQPSGPIPNDLQRLKSLDDYEVADNEPDPRGWKLIARDGDEIGKIDNLLASPAARRAYFALVDTGGWFQNKLFAVPLTSLRFDPDNKKALSPFTKEQFRNAPEHRDNERNYQGIYDYWTKGSNKQAGAGGARR
jgi:uncharacterized protein (TIGR02271 family)